MIEKSALDLLYREAYSRYSFRQEETELRRLNALALIAIVESLDKVLESLCEARHGN